MNEFDQFMKRELKTKFYLRYADDFVVLHQDSHYLQALIPKISKFLEQYLKLSLHPDKLSIKTLYSGIDFLGWVNYPEYRILRTKTKRRMLNRLEKNCDSQSLASYLGLLGHGNTFSLQKKLLYDYWFWKN
jgi:hypothetical protein